nr:MAG TPA: intron associated endonuclease [Crassvirales sp.]
MNGFIYIIKNTVNSKVYIGQTRTSVEQRWREHLRHAQYGDQIINRAMKKYGVDKFYIETLEICNIKLLDYREMYYIDLYDSTNKSKGYNVSIGGNTPRFKRKILSISDLVDLYTNKKFTLEEIATKYEVSRYIISTELKNAGIIIRDRHESSAKFNKIPIYVLRKYLEKGKSLRKAAKLSNIPYPTFRKACIYNHIEYNSSTSIQHTE